MAMKIDAEIIGYKVVREDSKSVAEDNVIQMHENLQRPEMLQGSTYKIKTPLTEHALYVTVNDIVLNPGTEHEKRRPFEVFINSKSMEHFQWIVALTRIISAVFRKGGDVTFMVEELHSVFDPAGGYFKKGKYTPSLVAEIGDVIERHLRMIGMIAAEEVDEHRDKYLAEKRAQLRSLSEKTDGAGALARGEQLCQKCLTKAVVKLDGCATCLCCGDSKCA
ncbi:MAG: NrdJb [Gammaproteobacteria bacterium]|nr:NrdJb [Gammaproteobacteria bacterium]